MSYDILGLSTVFVFEGYNDDVFSLVMITEYVFTIGGGVIIWKYIHCI